MAESAVVDFQRGIRRWTSNGDNIRGTSAAKRMKRDEMAQRVPAKAGNRQTLC